MSLVQTWFFESKDLSFHCVLVLVIYKGYVFAIIIMIALTQRLSKRRVLDHKEMLKIVTLLASQYLFRIIFLLLLILDMSKGPGTEGIMVLSAFIPEL